MRNKHNAFDLSGYQATRAAMQADPTIGRGVYESITQWQSGSRTQSCMREFEVETDEPIALGGHATSPDPIELMLAALGASLTGAWLVEAELRGVALARVNVRVVALIDLRGRTGLSPLIRAGVGRIDYSVHVESDAPAELLEAIRLSAEAHAPLMDNLRNPTRITGQIVRTRALVAA
ncbi:MAG: OsmC family protein [Alphaproteobacteria bacterium]|nr:OsmC family protein [Alphaproteobacteria bacterium]